jgi:hypothetical protein
LEELDPNEEAPSVLLAKNNESFLSKNVDAGGNANASN